MEHLSPCGWSMTKPRYYCQGNGSFKEILINSTVYSVPYSEEDVRAVLCPLPDSCKRVIED